MANLNSSTSWKDAFNDTPPIQYNEFGSDGRFYWGTNAFGAMTFLTAPPASFNINWQIIADSADSVTLSVTLSSGTTNYSLGSAVGSGVVPIVTAGSTSLAINMTGSGGGCGGFTGAISFTPSGQGDFTSPFTWQDASGNLPPAEFANDSDGTNF